MNPIL